MIAYKFLAAGAIGRFTGFRWEAGKWIDSQKAEPSRAGVHACRIRDLPIWFDDELW